MKTIHEYEPADIKLDGFADGEKMNEVHSFLMVQMFSILLGGAKPRPGDPEGQPMLVFQRLIAEFLNAAQKQGITVAKTEQVPAVFREENAG